MAHVLPMTPPCLWWVSHTGCQREIVEIGIWGASGEKPVQDTQLSSALRSALRLRYRGLKETRGGPR